MAKAIDTKLLGGIFLIVGTCIGGGMLALPITNGPVGFVNSTLFLFFCWLVMTLGALFILEINLWLPPHSNVISMAKITLGKPGQAIAWVTYLLIFYALLSAYISGGSDILVNLLSLIHLWLPQWIGVLLFAGGLSIIIYKGIMVVDFVNRGLIYSKFIVYFLLIAIIAPHVSLPNLTSGEPQYIGGMLMVLITSFGFATLVPSLRTYFQGDIKKLRKAIILGSLIPLFFYIAWDAIIIGIIPREGESGLIALLHSANPNSALTETIQSRLNNEWITSFYRFFTSVCILTSFLGVSLCVFDFLADGFKLCKTGGQGLSILAMTFLPPMLIVLFYPGIFITALSYAGTLIIILLLVLPILMVWSGRYIKKFNNHYQVAGGKLTLVLSACISITLIGIAIYQSVGHLEIY